MATVIVALAIYFCFFMTMLIFTCRDKDCWNITFRAQGYAGVARCEKHWHYTSPRS